VQHWSSRRGFDKFWQLWSGFVLVDILTGKKIFHAGDTGYDKFFKEIGDEFGSIDLALIPIGA